MLSHWKLKTFDHTYNTIKEVLSQLFEKMNDIVYKEILGTKAKGPSKCIDIISPHGCWNPKDQAGPV